MRVLLAIIVLFLSACAMPQADPERVQQATSLYGWVRDGETETFARHSTPNLRGQLTPELMTQAQTYTSPGEPESSLVLSWRANSVVGGAASYEIVQQHAYPDRTVIVQVLMVRQDGGSWLVDGFHVNAVSPAHAQAAAGFSLEGKSPLHFAALIGVILAPLVCLVTAGVAAWRRRWGWMIFSLFGFGQLVLNWNTGEWQFQALHFSVLSAGFFKGLGPLDPWTLMLSLPAPAVMFWLLRRYRPKVGKTGKAISKAAPTSAGDA